jgi:hypothetical protein
LQVGGSEILVLTVPVELPPPPPPPPPHVTNKAKNRSAPMNMANEVKLKDADLFIAISSGAEMGKLPNYELSKEYTNSYKFNNYIILASYLILVISDFNKSVGFPLHFYRNSFYNRFL